MTAEEMVTRKRSDLSARVDWLYAEWVEARREQMRLARLLHEAQRELYRFDEGNVVSKRAAS